MLETLAPLPVDQASQGSLLVASNVWFGDEADPARNRASSGEMFRAGESKPRALVVDDAPDIVEMLAMFLRNRGYEVSTAPSAPAALDAARDRQFDVIVSDIGMPGMNGYELAEALRALPDYSGALMIAVTGFGMYDNRERALQSGFDAFLTKPLNPTALIEIIESLRG